MTAFSARGVGAALFGAVLAACAMAATTGPSLAQSLDLDAIFNCNADGPLGSQTPEQCMAARDMVLNSCTACHTFVPIVKAAKTANAWNATLQVHRSRVPDLTDEQFDSLREFLVSHFNDVNPVPALPPELEALGTGLPF